MNPHGETNLAVILKNLSPALNEGRYVFCTGVDDRLRDDDCVSSFREKEGRSVIVEKALADRLQLSYAAVMSWITLDVHTSVEGVGLTAAFAKALAAQNISC